MSIDGILSHVVGSADTASLKDIATQDDKTDLDISSPVEGSGSTLGDVVDISAAGLEASKSTGAISINSLKSQNTTENSYASMVNSYSEQYSNARTAGERAKVLQSAQMMVQQKQDSALTSASAFNLNENKNSIEATAQADTSATTQSATTDTSVQTTGTDASDQTAATDAAASAVAVVATAQATSSSAPETTSNNADAAPAAAAVDVTV